MTVFWSQPKSDQLEQQGEQMTSHYLGMRENDLENKPYAKYWRPDMAPMQTQVVEAIQRGAEATLPKIPAKRNSLKRARGKTMFTSSAKPVLSKLTELCDMIRLSVSSRPSIGLKVASVNSKAASSR